MHKQNLQVKMIALQKLLSAVEIVHLSVILFLLEIGC